MLLLCGHEIQHIVGARRFDLLLLLLWQHAMEQHDRPCAVDLLRGQMGLAPHVAGKE